MTWLELDDNRNTVEIVTSRSTLLQRHDTGAVYRYVGLPGNWLRLDADPATVQVAADELWTPTLQGPIVELTVYQRRRDGVILSQRRIVRPSPGPEQPWVRLDDNPATVDITAAGQRLYQRHADGGVWAYTGTPLTGWDRIDDGHRAVQIVATDNPTSWPVALYRLDDDGRIWERLDLVRDWQELDANPVTSAITAAGSLLYQRHKDGRVFAARAGAWQLLDDNPATVQILAAGDKLFQRHADGSIWSYTGVPLTGWEKLDADPAAVQIAATADTLYKRRGDGSVHQFVG
jgi:hypothetical protein